MQNNNPASSPNSQKSAGGPALSISGGAAIVAPISAFPNGVPGNALVLLPIGPNGAEVEKQIVNGPMAMTMDDVWKLLGFNGPAVQVADENGRPIAIGLEDLLSGLEKHWNENQDDVQRGRVYAQELMKHGRFEKAEKVLGRMVATGGDGPDWVSLGVAQLAQKKLDKAEATLKGAANLMKDSCLPVLHLARVMKEKGDKKAEREQAERAIMIEGNSVDAWAYLTNAIREDVGEESAIAAVEELANAPVNTKLSAPYVALQGFYAGEEATRDKAVAFARKAVERAPTDSLALLCLSALYGQAGQIAEVIKLLAPHEGVMQRDVRIAHNYFEALMQARDLGRVTALLNKLATSTVREVKQFAIERSRAVSQLLSQQAQALPKA